MHMHDLERNIALFGPLCCRQKPTRSTDPTIKNRVNTSQEGPWWKPHPNSQYCLLWGLLNEKSRLRFLSFLYWFLHSNHRIKIFRVSRQESDGFSFCMVPYNTIRYHTYNNIWQSLQHNILYKKQLSARAFSLHQHRRISLFVDITWLHDRSHLIYASRHAMKKSIDMVHESLGRPRSERERRMPWCLVQFRPRAMSGWGWAMWCWKCIRAWNSCCFLFSKSVIEDRGSVHSPQEES